MSEKVLISGGGGFIASHVIKRILDTTDWNLVLLNKSESYHSKFRLTEIGAAGNPRVHSIRCDISAGVPPVQDVTYILHMGAESHVDISISEPERHIRSNIIGTYKMLEYARTLSGLKKMVQFSTDEVYGSAKAGETFTEWSRYNSGNPYAATKAAAEELSLAWENTFRVPVVITHSMNVFGERQQPSAVIPLFIKKIMDGKALTVHVDADGNPAIRSFIYGEDVAEATMAVLTRGKIRQKYGFAGFETRIDDLAKRIANICDRDAALEYAHARPGVDTRYSVTGTNMQDDFGWSPRGSVDEQLQKTVQWYLKHEEWFQ
jgi:dTDP-glucose 4,6-dehydratase